MLDFSPKWFLNESPPPVLEIDIAEFGVLNCVRLLISLNGVPRILPCFIIGVDLVVGLIRELVGWFTLEFDLLFILDVKISC